MVCSNTEDCIIAFDVRGRVDPYVFLVPRESGRTQ